MIVDCQPRESLDARIVPSAILISSYVKIECLYFKKIPVGNQRGEKITETFSFPARE